MPIDVQKALGAQLPATAGAWNPDQVILYHLGIGAGMNKPTDPKELEYTYERYLKVLPSFAVIPVFGALGGMNNIPGISINLAMVLHGEQEVVLHRPLPVSAEIENTARVAGIYDKGKAALIVLEVNTKEKGGAPLFTNRFTIFARGEGGFGGDPGPKAQHEMPNRQPDAVVESPTMPHQALIYRLSGDKNPLHCDPEFAKLAGFEKPILHGLCSFGIVCKAVVDTVLDGAVDKVASYGARFSGVVYPGETIVTSMWKEDGKIVIAAKTKERDTPVISNSAIQLR
ncbi:MAG: 3-alpha,7-alpha,12-alpha-trihydroxy-5-beta-cholest-24-enoyl-CoA hydratase [Candidatus Binatia bacterium]|nr:MAG: 3-alpha,7-alpha,12-alpha-trihydroxy-5-beta-cholest-24-enoyl-CoA hydratase [Candidatus Binatia bacterium]